MLFFSAVGIDFGLGAFCHPSSHVTICIKGIYERHQCFAANESRHSSISLAL